MPAPSTSAPFMNIGLGQIITAVRILFEAVLHRGELAALELVEARNYAFWTLLAGCAAFALILLGGFTITFTLAVAVWDRADRTVILALASVAYFLGAGLLVWLVSLRLRTWRPLEITRRQLRGDHACLQTIFTAVSEIPNQN